MVPHFKKHSISLPQNFSFSNVFEKMKRNAPIHMKNVTFVKSLWAETGAPLSLYCHALSMLQSCEDLADSKIILMEKSEGASEGRGSMSVSDFFPSINTTELHQCVRQITPL